MGVLTRDEILSAPDAEVRVVPVPEWGGDIVLRARSFTATQRLLKALRDLRKVEDEDGAQREEAFAVRLLHAALLEPRLSIEEIEEIMERKGAAPVSKIMSELYDLLGLTSAAVQAVRREFLRGHARSNGASGGGAAGHASPDCGGDRRDDGVRAGAADHVS